MGRRAVLLGAALAGSLLVAWSSLGTWQVPIFGRVQDDYYNLLVHGFQKGSLALDKVVPDALKNAENPWDPLKRPSNVGAHDISYFGGHYYIYFGVAPVVTLFWPFRVLTGRDLPIVYGTIAYSVGAFLAAAWLWLRILRDHFPRAGIATGVGGLLVLGLAGGQLVLARRISIWEPPIAAGHFFAVGMFAFGYLATQSRRPWGWLAASGVSLGLAFGSRPTLATAGAGLAVIVAAVGARALADGGVKGFLRRTARAICAAGLPLAAVVSGILAYNYARFGEPLEFGLKYQLTSQNEMLAHHFSLSFIPFNFAVYFLTPPNWGRYFPFVHPITQPPHPLSGYYGIEFVYGALVVCPVLWWIVSLPLFSLPRAGRPAVPAIAWAFAATAVASTALLLCFNTAAGRYTVDFMPWWVGLGILSWAVLDRALARTGRPVGGPGLLRALFLATAAFSLALAFFQSCDLHGLLKYWSPATYYRISRVFDEPTAFVERLIGYRGGPIEMDVTFPAHARTSVEPLVVTGVEYQKDYVYVYYLFEHGGAHRVQLRRPRPHERQPDRGARAHLPAADRMQLPVSARGTPVLRRLDRRGGPLGQELGEDRAGRAGRPGSEDAGQRGDARLRQGRSRQAEWFLRCGVLRDHSQGRKGSLEKARRRGGQFRGLRVPADSRRGANEPAAARRRADGEGRPAGNPLPGPGAFRSRLRIVGLRHLGERTGRNGRRRGGLASRPFRAAIAGG